MYKSKEQLRQEALGLIVEQLRAAEMRQGCTNYTYHAEILLEQLKPVIFDMEYIDRNPVGYGERWRYRDEKITGFDNVFLRCLWLWLQHRSIYYVLEK